MVVGEGDKVQSRISARGLKGVDGARVGLVPTWTVDVLVFRQVVQVLNQTTTEAHLKTQIQSRVTYTSIDKSGLMSVYLT